MIALVVTRFLERDGPLTLVQHCWSLSLSLGVCNGCYVVIYITGPSPPSSFFFLSPFSPLHSLYGRDRTSGTRQPGSSLLPVVITRAKGGSSVSTTGKGSPGRPSIVTRNNEKRGGKKEKKKGQHARSLLYHHTWPGI